MNWTIQEVQALKLFSYYASPHTTYGIKFLLLNNEANCRAHDKCSLLDLYLITLQTCVLREAHAGGESDRGIWAQMKSSTHFKQPLGKSIALWSAIKAHILLEVKECGGLPEVRVTKGGTDNLLS